MTENSWNNIFLKTKDLLINIEYTGSITCTPTAIIDVACKTDVGNFPYDEKHCTLTFGRYCLFRDLFLF